MFETRAKAQAVWKSVDQSVLFRSRSWRHESDDTSVIFEKGLVLESVARSSAALAKIVGIDNAYQARYSTAVGQQ